VIGTVTFVGQAPGRRTDPAEPLEGRCARFMAGIMGITVRRFMRFRRENLSDRWPGKSGKGDAFDMDDGMDGAERLCNVPGRVRLVLLGAKVARCFGLPWRPLARYEWTGGEALVVPHPSGVNRWWNEARNRRAARRALRAFAGIRNGKNETKGSR
jgi:hypothetical protein